MSNLVAFNSVFERAMRVESNRKSFGESLTVNVPTPVVLFAKSHIDALEEQLERERAVIEMMKKTAKKAGLIFDMEIIRLAAPLKLVEEPRESSFGIA